MQCKSHAALKIKALCEVNFLSKKGHYFIIQKTFMLDVHVQLCTLVVHLRNTLKIFGQRKFSNKDFKRR